MKFQRLTILASAVILGLLTLETQIETKASTDGQ